MPPALALALTAVSFYMVSEDRDGPSTSRDEAMHVDRAVDLVGMTTEHA